MAWALGTNATEQLKLVLVAWLQAQLAASPYKARLPKRSIAIAAPKGTERISGSIKVLLFTGADENLPHEFSVGSNRVMEEFHRVTIDVQSDEKGAPANEAGQVASIIRQLLSMPSQRDTLGASGVYNVREQAEALSQIDVELQRPINLTCTTDVLVS